MIAMVCSSLASRKLRRGFRTQTSTRMDVQQILISEPSLFPRHRVFISGMISPSGLTYPYSTGVASELRDAETCLVLTVTEPDP